MLKNERIKKGTSTSSQNINNNLHNKIYTISTVAIKETF